MITSVRSLFVYSDNVFRKPITKKNNTAKVQSPKKQSLQPPQEQQQPQSPQQQPSSHQNNRTKQQRAQQETSERLARKTFLLLLFMLDCDHGTDNGGSFTRLQSLSEEVRDYLRIYMA